MNEILNVLIVDDEYLIRNLIKMKVKWDELGMKVVGEAPNAKKALEMIDPLAPDIILTDICMPAMDGIEFSKIIVEKYPYIKIVVITGYDEFEYARSGIKLGIADFILKPINSVELMKTLTKLKENILAERAHIKEYDELKKQLEENRPFLREKFLNELLSEELCLREVEQKFDYFNININNNSNTFQVALFELNSCADNEIQEENRILFSMQCLSIIHDFFKTEKYTLIFSDNHRRVVVLSNQEDLDLEECCETLITIIIDKLRCFVNCGVGMQKTGYQQIKLSYKEAIEALTCMIFIGKNQVISYKDISNSCNEPYHVDANKIEKLSLYISAGAKANTLEVIDQLFTIPGYEDLDALTKMRLAAFNVFFICQYIINEQKINIDDIWKYDTQINDLILKADNVPDLKTYLKEYVSIIVSHIQQINNSKAFTLIEEVKKYLNDNMGAAELSLSSVAKEFYISSGHLGRLFKQQMSQTFLEYLTEIRMKKAEKLLRETDLKGYQVGEKVGIADPHYFSILFKKYTGFSIKEFRQM